ncbi:MAG: hypothetical protein U0559_14405 [Anaerolineae bacterium]
MSPDIEWNVRDGDEQATIAKTPSPRTSRGRRLLIALSVVLGASLGALYMAIPQPPKIAVLTPTPTIPPPPIEPVVAREARALADGDEAAFMAEQDPVDSDWYRAQQQSFKPWSAPRGGDRLYTILSQGTLPNGRQWVDLLQWRTNEVYLRETRFYRLRNVGGQLAWKRTRPDPSFWSGTTWQGRSAHFDVQYPAEDNEVAWRIVQRFERVYQVLCRDLNCSQRPIRVAPLTLIFDPTIDRPQLDSGIHLTITLPSPRVIGYSEPSGLKDDTFTTLAYQYLLPVVARLAAGDSTPLQANSNGEWFVQGVMAWEALRIELARDTPPEQIFINTPGELWPKASQGEPSATQLFYRDLLSDAQLVSLPELWHWPIDTNLPNDQFDIIDGEIDAAIAYIEETYGNAGVIKFLNALGPSRSFEGTIEMALNMSYADFEAQWLRWLDR